MPPPRSGNTQGVSIAVTPHDCFGKHWSGDSRVHHAARHRVVDMCKETGHNTEGKFADPGLPEVTRDGSVAEARNDGLSTLGVVRTVEQEKVDRTIFGTRSSSATAVRKTRSAPGLWGGRGAWISSRKVFMRQSRSGRQRRANAGEIHADRTSACGAAISRDSATCCRWLLVNASTQSCSLETR